MNKIIMLDEHGLPYTISNSEYVLAIRDKVYKCFLRTPLVAGQRMEDNVALYYLTRRIESYED